jgi:hypothetical protein
MPAKEGFARGISTHPKKGYCLSHSVHMMYTRLHKRSAMKGGGDMVVHFLGLRGEGGGEHRSALTSCPPAKWVSRESQ